MTALNETVEALAEALRESSVYDFWDNDTGNLSDEDYAARILAALPPGSALVTVETLAEALHATFCPRGDAHYGPICSASPIGEREAAAIIEHIRSGGGA